MKETMKTVKMKLLSVIALCAITSAHNITQLKVPLYADPRRAAELSCHFQMEDQSLHSVKWYRDTNEIFRYNPSLMPSIRLFNVTDIKVQGGECTADSCTVRIMPPPIATRAGYTCEVSTEGPKFQIVRKTKHMTVVGPLLPYDGYRKTSSNKTVNALRPTPTQFESCHLRSPLSQGTPVKYKVPKFQIARKTKLMTVVAMPDADPVIAAPQKVLKPGDSMFLNCTSDYSLPPAEINWYIDDELQKPETWERTELTPAQPGGLRRSWRGIRVKVPSTSSGAIRVRCEAILLVEPPVVRDSNTIITIHSRTQLSKYVANSGTNKDFNRRIVLLVITLTVNEISRYMSL